MSDWQHGGTPPPLIDRELLFGPAEIGGAQLSPDGKYLAFLKPWKNIRNIWLKKLDTPFDSARPATEESYRPISRYYWSRDGKYIVYLKDNDGDESFNLFVLEAAAAVEATGGAPSPRDLTRFTGVSLQVLCMPRDDPDAVYVGVNDRDKAWHDLYRLRFSSGERTLIRKNTDRISTWFFDLAGALRLGMRVAENGDQELLRVDPDRFARIYSCSVFETCRPLRFHKDNRRVYMETNRGDDVDLVGLALLDLESGYCEMVESDPLQRVDLGSAAFSEATGELEMTLYQDSRVRRYFRDGAVEADFRWLVEKLPDEEINVVSRTIDERQWLIAAARDTEPGTTYLFDRLRRMLSRQYSMRDNLPRELLAPMQTLHYKSSDGAVVPAYLTLPQGLPPQRLPMLVLPHGGPWWHDTWGFNALAQFWSNRGYAVLMPNFRGSSGYGKKYLNAGNGEWGRKMQDDLTWGVRRLVSDGIADPERVGIMGVSYGGYAALAGLAFTPDVYRAAVDMFGPSNLATLLAAIPPYWEAGRKMLYTRLADPGTPEGRAWLRERSPLAFADRIKAPLMVVQGANDPRVHRTEAEQIVIALRDGGRPVEYLLAPDEGHGFRRPANAAAMLMAAEKFFSTHLGGRYQEGGTPEAVHRLAEIAVDPKSVVLSKMAEATR